MHDTLAPMKRIGLLGAGTVGAALAQLINTRNDVDAVISKALVRDTSKIRDGIRSDVLTTDSKDVLVNADILVEVMGGTGLAGDAMLEHLKQNKKDHSTKLALLKMVGRRRRYLNYLAKKDIQGYRDLIKKLGIRR